jgi:hypothetical protein
VDLKSSVALQAMYGKGEAWSKELMSFVLPVPGGPQTNMPMIASVASAQKKKPQKRLTK